MKTIWFGWLIIGKLLIPPKRGTSNHIFVSFVSKEIKFLSWHGACAVLLATFGTFLLLLQVVFAPLLHPTSPELPNCHHLGQEGGLHLAACNGSAIPPAALFNPKSLPLISTKYLQPWKGQEDTQHLRICCPLFKKLFPNLDFSPSPLCNYAILNVHVTFRSWKEYQ